MRLFLRINMIMESRKKQRTIWILWSLSIVLPLILILFGNENDKNDRPAVSHNIAQGEHVPGNVMAEGTTPALTEPDEIQEMLTGTPEAEADGKGEEAELTPKGDGEGTTSEIPENDGKAEISAEPETGDGDETNTEPETDDDGDGTIGEATLPDDDEEGNVAITGVPQPDVKEERVIDPDKPMVALTFDDGPYRNNTKAIMELFEQYDGRATFFVVGYHLDVFGEATLEAYRRGFQIGNHTLNHPALRQISDAEGMEEIVGLNRKLNELGIPGDVMLRPPYGEFTQYLQENLTVPMIGWNVDSADWLTKDAENIYERVVGKVKDGDIVLLHDLHDATAEAMQRVVPALVEQGFQLVTVEELFRVKGIEPQAGEYYCYVR